MARQIADNLIYKAPKPIDDRLVFATKDDMLAYPEDYVYDGMIVYCREDNSYYRYNSDISVGDMVTSKWLPTTDEVVFTIEYINSGTSTVLHLLDTDFKNVVDRTDPHSINVVHPGSLPSYYSLKYLRDEPGYDKGGNECNYKIYYCYSVSLFSDDPTDITKDKFTAECRVLKVSKETYEMGSAYTYHYGYFVTQPPADGMVIFETLASIPTYVVDTLTDGTLGYCLENLQYYTYNHNNTTTEALGKWTELINKNSSAVSITVSAGSSSVPYYLSDHTWGIFSTDFERDFHFTASTHTPSDLGVCNFIGTAPADEEYTYYMYHGKVYTWGDTPKEQNVFVRVINKRVICKVSSLKYTYGYPVNIVVTD